MVPTAYPTAQRSSREKSTMLYKMELTNFLVQGLAGADILLNKSVCCGRPAVSWWLWLSSGGCASRCGCDVTLAIARDGFSKTAQTSMSNLVFWSPILWFWTLQFAPGEQHHTVDSSIILNLVFCPPTWWRQNAPLVCLATNLTVSDTPRENQPECFVNWGKVLEEIPYPLGVWKSKIRCQCTSPNLESNQECWLAKVYGASGESVLHADASDVKFRCWVSSASWDQVADLAGIYAQIVSNPTSWSSLGV